MWKLEAAVVTGNGDPKYFIEGPGRLTSALETLNSSSPGDRPQIPKERQITTPINLKLSNALAATTCRTIVASDNDVSNGFVKDGKALPYVFEATESGLRKRSNKILPVCGVCGKKFVCVTTMKRHLVTHTGEKPFSCKVCGKQYTQKGNLRVHERTHRNDRPFECNICHQKFYRKEPMQKHQWRQHAIVHFKSRPHAKEEEEEVVVAHPEEHSHEQSPPTQKPEVPLIPEAPSEAKPCLKHKMKLAQAYLREQRELGENLSSSGRDIVGLLNLSIKEPSSRQCEGCSLSFESSGALLDHIQPQKDFYKCCQCGQEFTQRLLLGQHVRTIHAANPLTTFTMQELIERGVEKSMSKREDAFTAPPSPPSVPLDLSPKSSGSHSKEDLLSTRSNNPLLNTRPSKEVVLPNLIPPIYKKQKTNKEEELKSSAAGVNSPSSGTNQPSLKIQSWKELSPYIKSDFIMSSERGKHDRSSRPQDGRTV
eukprot:TRINITY_DN1448_c0_g1_i1.p1 TRINITY_DN1448_c0_g1~~TRINITY_DN1448_c0_g1_i1.p1  ORF type:complete len:481 (-),score=134.47 TRINITY_DN1448_c0_g1_i1:720-2162(-)